MEEAMTSLAAAHSKRAAERVASQQEVMELLDKEEADLKAQQAVEGQPEETDAAMEQTPTKEQLEATKAALKRLDGAAAAVEAVHPPLPTVTSTETGQPAPAAHDRTAAAFEAPQAQWQLRRQTRPSRTRRREGN